MVMVIQDTPQNTMFTTAMFGEPVRELVDYIGYQYDQASRYLTDRARGWMENAGSIFQRTDYDTLLRTTRAVSRQLKGAFRDDVIQPLYDIGQFQTAGPVMQRWIMAEPTVRQLYHEQGCDGYSGTYVDMAPHAVGETHYDYRRVMDGVVVTDEQTGQWHADSYLEPLYEGDRDLMPDEQADIQIAWRHLKRHLRDGTDDPVSPWNGEL